MIFAPFKRGESQLLIDAKVAKFRWIDGKLHWNWNGICDLMLQERIKAKEGEMVRCCKLLIIVSGGYSCLI